MAKGNAIEQKENDMKNTLLAFVVAALAAQGAFAANDDGKAQENVQVKESTNPLTGTKTIKREYEQKSKDEKGQSAKLEVEEKTKIKRDGTVEESVDVEADSTTKQ